MVPRQNFKAKSNQEATVFSQTSDTPQRIGTRFVSIPCIAPQQHRNFVRVDIYNWGQINAFFKFTYASCAKAKTSWFVGRRYISPSARAPRPWPLECYTNLSYSRWLIGVLNVDLDYTTQICPIYSLMTILCFIAIFQHPITGRCHSWLSRIPFFTKQVVSFSFDVHITLNM